MFTGLIQGMGRVVGVAPFGRGRRFRIDLAGLAQSVRVGQSVAVNGACLTLTELAGGIAGFDAVAETVSRTNLGRLGPGDRVNLEPALKAGDALDGHFVQGHIDAAGKILAVDAARPEARSLKIELPENIRRLVAEKGSVAVDGVSLTVSAAARDWFAVAIIPATWSGTTLGFRKTGDPVNIEADALARYAVRFLESASPAPSPPPSGLDRAFLAENGFLPPD
ncbi:MAG: riboflavin synthase [Planctomycetota bacterium]|jgi:riboflavin synthase|nr:riboflavin synthase [Planctomycetota bacterium]